LITRKPDRKKTARNVAPFSLAMGQAKDIRVTAQQHYIDSLRLGGAAIEFPAYNP
jgi:hypothetical protein